jgi:ABC-type lipoprotein export system ATPase subunit
MNELIFKVSNLSCSYNNLETVLEISDLSIHRGKFTIILGISGGGKSTLLETLGLMNHTIKSGKLDFYPSDKAEPIDMKSLWDKNDQKSIANIQRNYFSFIFQNTNLMPNFTAYENICLTQMLEGRSFEEAKSFAREKMKEIGLPVIDENKKVTNLSIGQRQRLAFVRAITTNFEVIFGDEPTGNLDEFYASELMTILKNITIEKNSSAIVVSHSVELAFNFADQIILITKGEFDQTGKILKDNVFNLKVDGKYRSWKDGNGKTVFNLKRRIVESLRASNESQAN